MDKLHHQQTVEEQRTDENAAIEITEVTEIIITEAEANDGEVTEVTVVEIDTIDIEEYATSGKTPHAAQHYRIRIDKEQYTVDVPEMIGRELLTLAKKLPPDNYMILRILHGGESKPIGLNERTSFTDPGVERFVTLPKDQTEG